MQPRSLFATLTLLFSLLHPNFAQQPIVLRHGGAVPTVKFSPVNNSLIATAGDNNTIKLWDLRNDTVTTLRGHNHQVNAVTFSSNGQLLASGGDDFTFKLWNIPEQRHIATLEHITARHRSQVKDVAFSPDGQSVASAGYPDTKLWDVNNQTETASFQHNDWVLTITFSPSGQLLAAGDNEGTVKVWDIQKRQAIAQLEGDTTSVYSVQFSPDGQTLAGAGYDGKIKLWNVSNWEHLGTLENRSTVHTLNFSPEGKVLASTGHSIVTLWSVDSGKKVASLTGHTGWVLGTDFSPNGVTLVSGGDDGTIRLQNIETHLQTLQQPETVQLIYFLPRNRLPQTGINAKLETLIKDVQQFYANQMQNRGFGRKTFIFETNAVGKAVVHHVNGRFIDQYYYTDTTDKIMEEINEEFDTSQNIYLIAADVSSQIIEGENSCGGVGGGRWEISKGRTDQRNPGGWAIIPASGMCFSITVAAHELGHAFGLEHDFRSDTYLMSYGINPDQLSNCAAEWLDAHRYFNPI